MNTYLCKFRVNGYRTEETVRARDGFTARRIIEMKYSGQKIEWITSPIRQ